MRWPFAKNRNVAKQEQPSREQKSADDASAQAQTSTEAHREDPFIGAKQGAQMVFQTVIQGMKDAKGVHIESLLCALGALAGYVCQAGVRGEFVEEKGLSEDQVFSIVVCTNGSQYFFGDMVNKPLAENPYSLWSLAAGAVQHLGVNPTSVDLGDIFKHTAQTVGSEDFGVPRIPADHKPGDLPCNYVKYLWPALLPIAKQFCPASAWPMLYGLAAQKAILLGKDVIDPLLALSIVMESAIPMSKVDLKSL